MRLCIASPRLSKNGDKGRRCHDKRPEGDEVIENKPTLVILTTLTCVQSSTLEHSPQPPAIQSGHTSPAGARGLGAVERVNPTQRPLQRMWRRWDRDEFERRGSRGTFLACGQ